MLTTLQQVLLTPGANNYAAMPPSWLNALLGAADGAIKRYCKQNLEMDSFEEVYDGRGVEKLVLRQMPVWVATTTVAGGMAGLALPQATISVQSVVGFNPGPVSPAVTATSPCVVVQVGVGAYTVVYYTGVQPSPTNPSASPALTGCTGGTGNIYPGGRVWSPPVNIDQYAYGGQGVTVTVGGVVQPPFGDKSLLVLGSDYMVEVDRGVGNTYQQSGQRTSRRGLLRKIGYSAGLWDSLGMETSYRNKLAATRKAGWPVGQGNILVRYPGGYALDQMPPEIPVCCAMLTLQLARNVPTGAPLANESLGNYAYSLLSLQTDIPELSSIQRMLAPFRESSL